MATYIALRHPVTTLVTVFTNPDNLTNVLSIYYDIIQQLQHLNAKLN